MTKPIIYRRSEGETVAIFPDDPFDNHSDRIICYSHIGQHSCCTWGWVLECTTEADEHDVARLHHELLERGYYNYKSVPLQDYATLEGIPA